MFCALLGQRYQVSVYRTIGPLVFVFSCGICGKVPEFLDMRNCCCNHPKI